MTPSNADILILLAEIAARAPTQRAEKAIERLYLTYSDCVRRFVAKTWLSDPREVDEVVQDTFWQVWTQPERYRGDSTFKTWLLAIARNKAIDAFRRNARDDKRLESLDDHDADSLAGREPALPDIVHSAQLSETIKACMASLAASGKLSAAHLEVLHLAYIEDLSLGEIARITNQLENTVKSRLHYARLRLKASLARRLGGACHAGHDNADLADICFTA